MLINPIPVSAFPSANRYWHAIPLPDHMKNMSDIVTLQMHSAGESFLGWGVSIIRSMYNDPHPDWHYRAVDSQDYVIAVAPHESDLLVDVDNYYRMIEGNGESMAGLTSTPSIDANPFPVATPSNDYDNVGVAAAGAGAGAAVEPYTPRVVTTPRPTRVVGGGQSFLVEEDRRAIQGGTESARARLQQLSSLPEIEEFARTLADDMRVALEADIITQMVLALQFSLADIHTTDALYDIRDQLRAIQSVRARGMVVGSVEMRLLQLHRGEFARVTSTYDLWCTKCDLCKNEDEFVSTYVLPLLNGQLSKLAAQTIEKDLKEKDNIGKPNFNADTLLTGVRDLITIADGIRSWGDSIDVLLLPIIFGRLTRVAQLSRGQPLAQTLRQMAEEALAQCPEEGHYKAFREEILVFVDACCYTPATAAAVPAAPAPVAVTPVVEPPVEATTTTTTTTTATTTTAPPAPPLPPPAPVAPVTAAAAMGGAPPPPPVRPRPVKMPKPVGRSPAEKPRPAQQVVQALSVVELLKNMLDSKFANANTDGDSGLERGDSVWV